MAMFMILFRSLKVALIAIFLNLPFAAGTVLGLMGWMGISLDMMTITIAAITVGIAVTTPSITSTGSEEFARDGRYLDAMHRSHRTIGRAMFYTSPTIIVGFPILALSNFIPTIYFGLFTGWPWPLALLGALTLLPQLMVTFKPLGKDQEQGQTKG